MTDQKVTLCASRIQFSPVSQNLFVHHIHHKLLSLWQLSLELSTQYWFLVGPHKDIVRVSASRKRDIDLTMSPHILRQQDAAFVHRLPLSSVDGQTKGQLDWELQPGQGERHVPVLFLHGNTWQNQDFVWITVMGKLPEGKKFVMNVVYKQIL